jgi:glutamate synthase domain-containing protein 2/nitrite reductase/ring-hydroxylating ferredoxin subunit
MPEWIEVCELSTLEEGEGAEVWVNGRPVALFLYQGMVYALDDRCPHREGQLSAGSVENGEAICPLHGWNFDLATGVSPYNPTDSVPVYPARVEAGRVQVDAAKVPPLPEASFVGYQGRWHRWNQDARGHAEIRRLAKGRSPAIKAMGAAAPRLSPFVTLDHFHLSAAQLQRLPRLDDEPVSTAVEIGKGAGTPLRIALPAYVSHMSFGALSRETKIALARGAAAAGSLTCSGEGGMLPEERAAAGQYIFEIASAYYGWDDTALQAADAFELKIGQSAKPGMGGSLPAHKVTTEIARVRGIEAGCSSHSPARFPDLADLDAVGRFVSELRTRAPDKPIGIKIAANDVEGDIAAALSLQPDFITLDSYGGGTGSAPMHIRDQFGMPLVMALPVARRLLNAHNAAHGERPVSLIATGGIRTPADIIKALALGADACALATAALIALGCEYYRACNSNRCPVGITTQDEKLRARLDMDEAATRVTNFFNGIKLVLSDYLRAMGHDAVADISVRDLIPISRDAKALLTPAE